MNEQKKTSARAQEKNIDTTLSRLDLTWFKAATRNVGTVCWLEFQFNAIVSMFVKYHELEVAGFMLN